MSRSEEDLAPMDLGDLTPAVVPVRLGGEDYVLREASGAVAVMYRNKQLAATRIKDGKFDGVGNAADAEPYLVSLCLFKLVDGVEHAVRESTVRAWRQSVQTVLFERVKRISGMDEEETEESLERQLGEVQRKLDRVRQGDPAKNSPAATGAGSS